MASIRLGAVGFDCADPAELAAFWSALLGGTIIYSTPDLVVVRLEHLIVNAYRVEDYVAPTWPRGEVPKQMHVDLPVDDLDAAERRAVELGAVRAAVQRAPDVYRVMCDPAGHPFCLTTDALP
jgi:hypothetical protein